jgi:UDP-N-acetylmuramyl pentapeptide phosphotransferase/UDP-N-acetylglucosamine-1-phosphate transferase
MAIHIIIFFIFSLTLLLLCKKFKLCLDIKKDKHKNFASYQENYFIGGILLISFFAYYFLTEKDYLHFFFFISIFFIGIFADLRLFNNPKLRLLVQILIILTFIFFLKIEISSTRLEFFDNLLNNVLFNHFFTVFCLVILINGSNFVDGINTLLINYYILVLGLLLFFFNDITFDYFLIQYLFSFLIIILLFNLFGQIILGDSGSYILSLFVGLILIRLSSENESISPYFVIMFVWYPCFELLFSMIRRLSLSSNSYEPDTFHLHQLLLKLIKQKFNLKNNNINHFITSSIINLYNFFVLLYAANYYTKTNIMLSILTINLFIYIFSYFFLRHKLKLI